MAIHPLDSGSHNSEVLKHSDAWLHAEQNPRPGGVTLSNFCEMDGKWVTLKYSIEGRTLVRQKLYYPEGTETVLERVCVDLSRVRLADIQITRSVGSYSRGFAAATCILGILMLLVVYIDVYEIRPVLVLLAMFLCVPAFILVNAAKPKDRIIRGISFCSAEGHSITIANAGCGLVFPDEFDEFLFRLLTSLSHEDCTWSKAAAQ